MNLTILWSVTVSIYLVGGTIGAFTPGLIVDRLGRKKSLILLNVFSLIAAIFFGFCKKANSYEMLIIGRLLIGFSCGAGAGIVPMYLTEIAPVRIRGAMGVLHQLALTSGIFVSQAIGLRQILGSADRWPILLAAIGLPCLLSGCVLYFMPDSPRHLLLNKKDRDAAEKALKRLRNCSNVDLDLDEIEEEIIEEDEDDEQEPEWTLKSILAADRLRLPLVLIIVLGSCQQLSGINAVFYYSSAIYESAGIAKQNIQYANLITGFINVVITIISVGLVEKAGRRVLLLGGMGAMVVSALTLMISINLQEKVTWLSYIAIISVLFFVVGFAIGLGSIPQFIGAELFRPGPRPIAMSIAGFFNWLCNFLVGIGFPPLAGVIGEYSFIIFIACIIIFGLFIFKQLPETKQRTIEEIYTHFKRRSTRRNGTARSKDTHNMKALINS
ncbi:DgyrCDS6987 [Dimorphilus gyrociliatus]|uniref:DgyrCDS6987 n=1 Tax=Dimorphilus gyrociliatus TaxID=2664684 RepID=A0A7I8VRY1_9ANNE|nr:DgyrCDS6987 [Dimorphilus gyrociliatus]